MLVIPGAVNGFCSPQTAANTVLFSSVHLTPCFLDRIRGKGKMPSLGRGNPDRPLLFIYLFINFFPSFCEISEADATLTTEDFRTLGLTGDGWRSIYITLPPELLFSFPSPSPPPFLLFNLENAAERVLPGRGIVGI